MGYKIFISYKYSDDKVMPLKEAMSSTVRQYVDELSGILEKNHIYKGEDDGEDLGTLSDSTIGSKLGDKIFDSTITIVCISKGMKESISETEQWIPWEVSYSLKEQSRNGINSKTNAVLAVVLPDENGSYEYFIAYNKQCNSITLKTSILFRILRENMFNIKKPSTTECNNNILYHGYSSFIHSVIWSDFVGDVDKYINIALEIWRNRNDYNIRKDI